MTRTTRLQLLWLHCCLLVCCGCRSRLGPPRGLDCNTVSSPSCLCCLVESTVVYLSFHPMARKRMHVLKGLACRKRVAAASSPATCKQGAALTSPARHACGCVRPCCARFCHGNSKFCRMGPNLGIQLYWQYCSISPLFQLLPFMFLIQRVAVKFVMHV